MKGFPIDNPYEYMLTLIIMPLSWCALVLFFPIYVLMHLILVSHKKYRRIEAEP